MWMLKCSPKCSRPDTLSSMVQLKQQIPIEILITILRFSHAESTHYKCYYTKYMLNATTSVISRLANLQETELCEGSHLWVNMTSPPLSVEASV